VAVQLHNSFSFQLSLCAYWEEQSWNLYERPSYKNNQPQHVAINTTKFSIQHPRKYQVPMCIWIC